MSLPPREIDQDLSLSVHNDQATQSKQGCGLALLAAVIWIGLVAVSSQFGIWLIEQGMVEGSIRQDPGRWLIALIAGLGIFVPFALLSLMKNPFYRAVFKTWALAGVLVILLVPTRLLTISESQGVAVLQIAGMVLLSGLLLWKGGYFTRLAGEGSTKWDVTVILLTMSTSILLSFAWVMNGALGSWLDTLLGLVVGLVGSLTISLILHTGLHQLGDFYGSTKHLLQGVIVSQVLVIFATALGINGNEWILLLVLPILGWAATVWISNNPKAIGFIIFLGFMIAWPLVWVDADELSLVISMGQGELIEWIGVATTISLVSSFLFTITLLITARLKPARSIRQRWVVLGFSLSLIGIGVLYFWQGNPGFFGEKLFVILKDQADLSSISTSLPYNERRLAVYTQLVTHAEQTQKELWSDLRNFGLTFQPYYLVNAIMVDAGPFARFILSLHPAVDRVLTNPILRPLPEPIPVTTSQEEIPASLPWNLRMVQADRVWQEFGTRGKGIIVGQSDSGVQGDHQEFSENYYEGNGNGDYSWLDPWNGTSVPTDTGGHGTHTLGIILGKTVGVAPEAGWIGCVNLARNLGNPSLYLDCMQFMLAPYPRDGDPFTDGDPSRGAHVLNNSWGCPSIEGCDTQSLQPAVEALRIAGIFVIVSAGNSGFSGCGSVDSPLAIYGTVYTVGSIDRFGDRSDFSSLGPVLVDGSRRTKPDILAPGEGIDSAYPGNGYNTLSGTSMAGPHVAGVVALMWSANPSMIGEIDQTTAILNRTAKPYTGLAEVCDIGTNTIPSNISGYGIVDAYAAVKAAIEYRP